MGVIKEQQTFHGHANDHGLLQKGRKSLRLLPVNVIFPVFREIEVDNKGNLLYINTTSLK